MAYNCELPSSETREMMILSRAYRMRHGKGDRNPDEKSLGETTDPVTGLVKQGVGLKAPGEAIRGVKLVLLQSIQPDLLALEHLQRDDGTLCKNVQALHVNTKQPDPLRPDTPRIVVVLSCNTNERDRADAEVEHVKKHHPEWSPEVVMIQGRSALTEEEAHAASDLSDGFEATLRDMASKGWVTFGPTVRFDPVGPAGLPSRADAGDYSRGVDDSGSIFMAKYTHEGIEEAERRVAGDPHWSSQGAFSSLEGHHQDVKAAAVQRNKDAYKMYVDGQ